MPEGERLFYSSVDAVKQYTGVRPEDLGLPGTVDQGENETEITLEEVLEQWLVEAKSLIDLDRNRDFHADYAQEVNGDTVYNYPPGLDNVAMRLVANMVAQAVMRRETPIVQIDDFTINMVDDQVFTQAIRADLRRFLPKPRFRFYRVRNQRQIEDDTNG